MQKLDFKTPLHFDEFPPVSTELWESIIESDLKGKDYKNTLQWNSGEGVSPLPFYRQEHLKELGHAPDVLKTEGAWCIVETIEQKDARSANAEALQALENGAMGLEFCPSENFLTSEADLQTLLHGIHLEYIELYFGSSLSTPEIANWLSNWCTEKDLNTEDLSINFYSDPFSLAVRTGQLLNRPELEKYLSTYRTLFQNCMVDVSVYAESGATIVQQLAFALAAGNEILGMYPNDKVPLEFNFSTGNHYFLEIAKFRAFRILWKQISDTYEVSRPRPKLIASTALWNKSQTDAHNNMLRATTEAMSAALGGCDAFTLYRYDLHFEDDSDFSSRIARNTQLILQEEAYLHKVADPGAGSYYIEKLTDELAAASWGLFQEIEAKGGFYDSLKQGLIQDKVHRSRNGKIQAYRDQEKVMVGINKYRPEGEDLHSPNVTWSIPAYTPSEDNASTIESLSPLNIETELEQGDA